MNCNVDRPDTQALSVSEGNNYSEDQLMRIFLNNFHQGGKYGKILLSRTYNDMYSTLRIMVYFGCSFVNPFFLIRVYYSSS